MPDVLVADADRDARERYGRWLAARGARVHEAAEGREALVRIYSVHPQVVVLDASLPCIDGLQLCECLRGDAATLLLRIVAITSDDSPEHVRRFYERGADVVLVKPITGESLVAAAGFDAGAEARQTAVGRKEPRSAARLPAVARTVARVRSYERYVSTNPPEPPPHLRCPHCDCVLQYDRSHVGGVSERQPEQWDYFVCARHGLFQYRHRTRKLRPAS